MKNAWVPGVALGLAMLLAACEPASAPAAPGVVVQRAAFDLGCPAEQLHFIPLKTWEPRAYGAVGCQKRVTYIELCSIAQYGMLSRSSCSWTMDGPIQAAAPPPAPSTPPVAASAASPPAP